MTDFTQWRSLVDGTEYRPIPDSGVSRYTFDNGDTSNGTAVDVWGGNDATINGATTGVSGANQSYTTNEAYSLDGSDDYLTAPYTNPSTISLACWINLDGVISNQIIASVWSPTSSEQAIKLWHNDTTDDANKEGARWEVNTSAGLVVSSNNAVLSTNTWYHLVGTYDGSSVTLYIDGSQVDSISHSGDISTSPLDYTIGAQDPNAPVAFYGGDLDDMRLYDKGLSATEVLNLYNTGSING